MGKKTVLREIVKRLQIHAAQARPCGRQR